MNRNIHRQLADERGVDIRNPSTAFLGVDSADRYSSSLASAGNTTTPYDINLSSYQNYLNGFFTRIALTEIRFPWNIPTITARNNLMYANVYSSGVYQSTQLLSIGQGWYTAADLALQVNAAMAALVDATGTVVWNPSTYNYTAAVTTAGITFYFYPYQYPGQDYRTGLYEMMNWNFPKVDPTNPSSPEGADMSFTSGVPTMLSTQYVDVCCNQLTYNQDVKDSSTAHYPRDVLCRLYFTSDGLELNSYNVGSVPFTMYRNFNFPKQIRWDHKQPVGQILIQVYDDSGYLLTTDPSKSLIVNSADGDLPDYQFSLLATEV